MPVVVMLVICIGAVGLFLALPGRGVTLARAGLLLLVGALAVTLTALVPLVGPAGDRAWFVVLAAIGILAALRVITHSRPVYSALFFILVVVATAGLVLLMDATFLSMSLLIVYAGAILVTYMFVIMLAQQGDRIPRWDAESREPFFGVLGGFVILAIIAGRVLAGWPADAGSAAAAALPGSVRHVGALLLTEYVVGVQIAGVLLLAAMVGAVAVARRRAWLDDGREVG